MYCKTTVDYSVLVRVVYYRYMQVQYAVQVQVLEYSKYCSTEYRYVRVQKYVLTVLVPYSYCTYRYVLVPYMRVMYEPPYSVYL